MTEPHPTIQYLANTNAAAFPLILIIGREPNTDRPIANTIGPYDFRDAPRCAFWNTSYAMLATITGQTTRDLKQHCIARAGSPLIYADALPHGLLNEVGDKHTIRRQLPRAEVAAHVARVFSHRTLIDRVQLIITSGLLHTAFTDAKKLISAHAATEEVPVIDVPFFYGTNTKKIAAALTPADRELLTSIWKEFTR
jgi:hypothetical protein